MFNSILVPLDLADTNLAKPAIATAATLSQTWNGMVRLLNVLPMTPVIVTLLMFVAWMCLTTAFAMWQEESLNMLNRVMKTMVMALVAAMLIKTRKQVFQVLWVLACCLGYYGTKGGVFTAATGGGSCAPRCRTRRTTPAIAIMTKYN